VGGRRGRHRVKTSSWIQLRFEAKASLAGPGTVQFCTKHRNARETTIPSIPPGAADLLIGIGRGDGAVKIPFLRNRGRCTVQYILYMSQLPHIART
jgi:hypothetical protein